MLSIEVHVISITFSLALALSAVFKTRTFPEHNLYRWKMNVQTACKFNCTEDIYELRSSSQTSDERVAKRRADCLDTEAWSKKYNECDTLVHQILWVQGLVT